MPNETKKQTIFTAYISRKYAHLLDELIEMQLTVSRAEVLRNGITNLIERVLIGKESFNDPITQGERSMKNVTFAVPHQLYKIMENLINKGYFASRSAFVRVALQWELIRWKYFVELEAEDIPTQRTEVYYPRYIGGRPVKKLVK